MQQGFIKSYRYLLSNLIPREHLSKERVQGIEDAVASRKRTTLLREAFLAMEELSKRGIYEREGVDESSGKVLVDYMAPDRRAKVTLEMTRGEWSLLSGAEERQAVKKGVPAVLSGIISSLSLNNSSVTTAFKLQKIIELTSRVNVDSKGFLVLGSDLNIPGLHEGENLREEDITNILKDPFYGPSIEKGKIFLISDPGQMKKSYFSLNKGVRKIILIPLLAAERKIGVFEIHYSDITDVDRELLFNYSLIGRGIIRLLKNNIQLEQMVSVDRLTKVNNRNYYENQVPLEIERASRDKKCLAFLIIDIDHFKRFNDKYGHDVGDEVLKWVAKTIKSHLRKIDLFIRYGGEEFIAVLPGAESEAAMRTAERLRDVVENTKLELPDGRSLSVTVSIGGSIFPLDSRNQSELFRHADESLLKAKREGRNRIIFYKP